MAPMADAVDPLFLAFQAALAGRYALERELGRGGMGIVYLAQDARLERPVAIKLLPPALASQPELRAHLLREARTAAKLSHPNIVPVHAVDEVGEFAFFVMAYVEGETLGARLRAGGPLPPFEAGRILREVGWALAYAHARGVVHRDVKPDNVLLERAQGRALVTDFGIAQRVAGPSAGAAGEIVGTPEFMSPEQACGEPVDGRSDLYSLGVVAYQALSGALPFRGATSAEVLAHQVNQSPQPLAHVAPQVPRGLAAAVERCLAKRPDHRFPTGEAFVEAVDVALGGLAAAVERCLAKRPDHRVPTGEALVEAVDVALASERRLPMAVRVFLSEGKRRTAFRLFAAWLVALAAVPAGLAVLVRGAFRGRVPPQFGAGIAAVALLLATLAVLTPLARLVERSRRLVRAGYERDDLLHALRLDLAERREELGFLGGGAARFERVLRRVVYGALGVAAVTGVLAFVVRFLAVLAVFATFSAACAAAVVAGVVARELESRRGDAREVTRLRFWGGPLGRWIFRLAARS